MTIVANQNAGQPATCKRCGEPCKVAEARNEDARMLRLSKTPEGYCANCAVAEWFFVMNFREMHPTLPKGLDLPHVQAQFAVLMKNAGADMDPAEINWGKVIEHWDLPFAKRAKGRSPRRRGG
ncbi:MAG: hypothetical protein EKK55_07720 [Rhodocyclaceae bacterium]|nr:MAG: hypothetical protein EKK55_07720 [Rhodocyclaceae bacterium]